MNNIINEKYLEYRRLLFQAKNLNHNWLDVVTSIQDDLSSIYESFATPFFKGFSAQIGTVPAWLPGTFLIDDIGFVGFEILEVNEYETDSIKRMFGDRYFKLKNKSGVVIKKLYVHEDFRNHGYGTGIIETIKDIAVETDTYLLACPNNNWDIFWPPVWKTPFEQMSKLKDNDIESFVFEKEVTKKDRLKMKNWLIARNFIPIEKRQFPVMVYND